MASSLPGLSGLSFSNFHHFLLGSSPSLLFLSSFNPSLQSFIKSWWLTVFPKSCIIYIYLRLRLKIRVRIWLLIHRWILILMTIRINCFCWFGREIGWGFLLKIIVDRVIVLILSWQVITLIHLANIALIVASIS